MWFADETKKPSAGLHVLQKKVKVAQTLRILDQDRVICVMISSQTKPIIRLQCKSLQAQHGLACEGLCAAHGFMGSGRVLIGSLGTFFKIQKCFQIIF